MTNERKTKKNTGTKKIKTERLILRKIMPHDFFAFYPWYTDPELIRFARTDKPFTVWMSFRFTVGRFRHYADKQYYQWAIVYKGKMSGFIELFELRNKKGYYNISYKLDMSLKNRGITTEALIAVLDYFKTQDVKGVIGRCDVENIASKRVMEKAGMKSVGDPSTNPKIKYTNGTLAPSYMFQVDFE